MELFLTLEKPIAVIIGSLLHAYCEITNFKKRVHLGKQLECQLANEDELQPKSVIKEIVLRIVFT